MRTNYKEGDIISIQGNRYKYIGFHNGSYCYQPIDTTKFFTHYDPTVSDKEYVPFNYKVAI